LSAGILTIGSASSFSEKQPLPVKKGWLGSRFFTVLFAPFLLIFFYQINKLIVAEQMLPGKAYKNAKGDFTFDVSPDHSK
jgi:hypothetical protein